MAPPRKRPSKVEIVGREAKGTSRAVKGSSKRRKPVRRPRADVRHDGTLSPEAYKLLVESVRDYAIYLLDPEGRVSSWNAGASHVHGYEAAEVIGKHFSLFYVHADVATGKPATHLEIAKREGRYEEDGWRSTRSGNRIWANAVITPLADQERHLGFAVITRDRTERHLAEETLRESEERFRLMVDSVRDYAIFMLDPSGRVQSWNAGARRIKGYLPEEIIGSHISRFYTPEDQKADRAKYLLAEAVRVGRVEDEGFRVRKDGTRFWADVVITAMFGAAGDLRGFVKVTRDLTDRRAAEESLRQSEERFRMLVESVRDYAIFMLSPEGRVATWNGGAQRIKGYTPEEIVGKSFELFYPPEDVAAGKPKLELEVATREGRFEEESWRVRKDGTRFWASVVLTAVRDTTGKLVGFAKITRDMSEKRRAEEERLRLAQAQEAIRMRDEFLSIASHELKTPLTALQLQLEGLSQRMDTLDPRLAHKVERATRSALRLVDLVENLLDVSRIATGRFTLVPEEIDAAALLREVHDRVAESAVQAGCEVTVQAAPGVKVSWDRLRIEQVVMNLLSNAFKYAAGSRVRIELSQDGEVVTLAVADEGPGVPTEAMERIFDRFERAASLRNYGGLGLGLYVSRQIVEAHGGTIGVEPVSPHGARFVIKLPARFTAAPRAAAAPERGLN